MSELKTLIIELTDEEWDMLIEGIDSLKKSHELSKAMFGAFVGMAFKPRDGATPEQIDKYEKFKEKQKLENMEEEKKEREFTLKADKLKAKIILAR